MDEAERCDYIAMVRDGTYFNQWDTKSVKSIQYGVDTFDEVFIQAGRTHVMRTWALIKRICLGNAT